MMTAEELIRTASAYLQDTEEEIVVLWHRTDANRVELAGSLRNAAGALSIVPVILREKLFFSPNALASDLVELFERNRSALEHVTASRLVILILSRSALDLGSTSSLQRLPDWLPRWGGLETPIRIVELEREVLVPLSFMSGQGLRELGAYLASIESLLAQRLPSDPQAASTVYSVIRSSDDPPVDELWEVFRAFAQQPTDHSYRPTAREQRSLLTRLIRLAQTNHPDKLLSCAMKLAPAFGLDGVRPPRPPFLAVLMRPQQKVEDGVAFMYSLVMAVFGAYQLLNGDAHAGDYPKYTSALLESTLADIRRSLAETVSALQ